MIGDQTRCEQAFVLWDMVHDRTHSRGDLPFDPFMIKQRQPFWMYGLEELRCDLTAFKEAVKLEAEGNAHGRDVQYAVLFDRMFRFPVARRARPQLRRPRRTSCSSPTSTSTTSSAGPTTR
ncbi:hypothetical protein SMICM17S_02567 [Streptomyces microflavus]